MLPAKYSHITPEKDKPSPAVECNAKEDRARQEFKVESDVNVIIKKYGGNLPLGNARFGAQEFGVDRLEALARIDRAVEAFGALPEAVRERYPTYVDLYRAVLDGSFVDPTGAEVPSASGGAGTSDSASS